MAAQLSRRDMLEAAAVGIGAAIIPGSALADSYAMLNEAGEFVLPPLPYAEDALEPYIDARTMGIHHGKHHAGYTSKLNAALDGTDLVGQPIEDILANLDSVPEDIRTAVRNNGGGYANHCLFWQVMSPDGGGEPSGALANAVKSSFGDFASFQAEFSAAAGAVFGTGWAWLVARDGGLAVETSANQDTPLMTSGKPILGIDVWEHAYYLNYQNRRADYIAAFFHVIHWAKVAEFYG